MVDTTYFKRADETIDQYNARIAAYRSSSTTTTPTTTQPKTGTTTPTYTAPKTGTSTPSPYSGGATYSGGSIVDFLSAAGQPTDYASRQALATKYGITDYSGSSAQNTMLLNILKGFATGNVSPLGVPNTLSSPGTMPSLNTPLDASKLGNTAYGDLSKLLGANIGPDTVGSDIAGLLSLYGKSGEADTEYEKLQGDLVTAMGSLGGEAADLQAAYKKEGVYAAYNQVKELSLKAAQLEGELTKFDAETIGGRERIAEQAIPTDLITGQQAQYQKQRDLTRLSKAAELSATIALAQAYRGNAQLGMELAQKSVDLKYMPIINRINTLKTQLGFASDKLSKEDASRAKVIDTLLGLKLDEINTQKDTELKIQQLAIEAAANGAPLSVVNSMKAATDLATAATIGSAYIKGDLESIAKGGSSSSSSSGTDYNFTPTQLRAGAAAAGMSTSEFQQLDADVQNWFVNGSMVINGKSVKAGTAIKLLIDSVVSGETTTSEVISAVRSSTTLPGPVKEYLLAVFSDLGGGSSSIGTNTEGLDFYEQGTSGSSPTIFSKVKTFFSKFF